MNLACGGTIQTLTTFGQMKYIYIYISRFSCILIFFVTFKVQKKGSTKFNFNKAFQW